MSSCKGKVLGISQNFEKEDLKHAFVKTWSGLSKERTQRVIMIWQVDCIVSEVWGLSVTSSCEYELAEMLKGKCILCTENESDTTCEQGGPHSGKYQPKIFHVCRIGSNYRHRCPRSTFIANWTVVQCGAAKLYNCKCITYKIKSSCITTYTKYLMVSSSLLLQLLLQMMYSMSKQREAR